MKIVVLCGGCSEEQHTSRSSAKCVSQALEAMGHTSVIVEYDINFIHKLKNINPDAVFPIVQGKHHGDGAVQAILELMQIPYVGSRPHAAALINNKTSCKKIWSAAGIKTPDFFEFSYDEFKNGGFAAFNRKAESYELALPLVVKAPSQGGRYGLVFVKDNETFLDIEGVFKYDDVLLVERYVKGRFITHGLLEINGVMTAMSPVEIIDATEDEFKCYGGDTSYKIPPFTKAELENINAVSLEAARLVGASSIARLDYHLCDDELFLLEINAVPGLTNAYSDIIKCAEVSGYDYNSLIATILSSAKKG